MAKIQQTSKNLEYYIHFHMPSKLILGRAFDFPTVDQNKLGL